MFLEVDGLLVDVVVVVDELVVPLVVGVAVVAVNLSAQLNKRGVVWIDGVVVVLVVVVEELVVDAARAASTYDRRVVEEIDKAVDD